MPQTKIEPNDRYAIVGKTGSGKTSFTVVLASKLVQRDEGDWQIWWLDTKGDTKDIKRLRDWGFVHVNEFRRDIPRPVQKHNWIYFPIREREGGASIVAQAQQLFKQALSRRKVLLVADEYTHVIVNARNPGRHLGNVFRTGRGLNVGLIGCTQEPVYVPRQLLSQAGHTFLFDLHFPKDRDYVREIFPYYHRPGGHKDEPEKLTSLGRRLRMTMEELEKELHIAFDCPCREGEDYGFFTSWLDKRRNWLYYRDQRAWYEQVYSHTPPGS